METVNILALHYTVLHREIIVLPIGTFKSSTPLFSCYSKGGSFMVPTSSDHTASLKTDVILHIQAQLLYKI